MFKAGSIVGDLTLNTGGFSSGLQAAEREASGFPSMVGANIIAPLLQAAEIAARVGSRIADALMFGVKLAADYETAEVSLSVLLGSVEQAKDLMADLSKFADATPLKSEEIVKATTLLVGMGNVAKDDVIPTLKMLGDVSSLLGKPLDDMAYIYAEIRSTGEANGEMLRRLAMAGVPIWQTLADQMGVTVEEVHKLASEGRVTADDVTAAFRRMSGEGGRFHDGLKRQSETLSGLWSTLTDNIDTGLRKVADAFLQGLDVKGGLKGLIDEFQAKLPEIIEQARAFAREIGPDLKASAQETMKLLKESWPEIKAEIKETTAAVRELSAELRELLTIAKALSAGSLTGLLLSHPGATGTLLGGSPASALGHLRGSDSGLAEALTGGPLGYLLNRRKGGDTSAPQVNVGQVNVNVDPKATADELSAQIYGDFDKGVNAYVRETTAQIRRDQVARGLGGGNR